MHPHQQRVVQEKAELDERLDKLTKFASEVGGVLDGLPTEEKQRLTRQQGAMQEYSSILAERIAAFGAH